MSRESLQLNLSGGVDPVEFEVRLRERLQALPGLLHFGFGRNLPGSWGAADCTLDLLFADAAPANLDDLLGQLPGIASIERVAYRRIGGGLREPGLAGGIWRTLLLRVRPQATVEQRAALEQDLLRMPDYIGGIRNWQLARVSTPGHWTHVWQQEFACVDDLLGEYLIHPYHWAWVDRSFDPDCPDWSVDAIAHAFCPLQTSLLGRAASNPDN
ncbi:Dabb family protein [Pseudomonas resinovorans]|uniref:Dabb family protein n=1 Tax=Metapseudomonas resinovorans TaxID=53412 RepID=UPI00237FA5F0|nr:Dabb family protein [Pseudomonas resinovorans]MDE3736973.1 Dabb family protein [Pseudomonas resinovorans]